MLLTIFWVSLYKFEPQMFVPEKYPEIVVSANNTLNEKSTTNTVVVICISWLWDMLATKRVTDEWCHDGYSYERYLTKHYYWCGHTENLQSQLKQKIKWPLCKCFIRLGLFDNPCVRVRFAFGWLLLVCIMIGTTKIHIWMCVEQHEEDLNSIILGKLS